LPNPPSHISPPRTQVLENEVAKAIAKKERERLKLQEKIRKEQVEKMRTHLNDEAAAGEVSLLNAF